MEDRLTKLEKRLAAVERRLAALERKTPAEAGSEALAPEPSLGDGLIADVSVYTGRILLIFGGAYLLRAITDYQFVPTPLGLSMGASYALCWLYMARKKSHRDAERTSAALYGGTSVLLTLPLLVEAISRFELLTGGQSIVALVIYCVLALSVAAAENLRTLGWLTTAGGIVTAFAILIVSHAAFAVFAFLLLLGLGILAVVYRRGWMGPQWLGAAGANAGLVALVVFSRNEQWSLSPGSVAIAGTVLLLAYLASFTVRSHLRGQELGIFETVQAFLAAVLAYWAVSSAARADELSLGSTGALCMLLGIGAYVLALSPVTRRVRGRNFFYYSSFGLFFVLCGSLLLLTPTATTGFWLVLALGMAWFSGRTGWVALSLQCTLLIIATGIRSGILATGWLALSGDPSAAWPALEPLHVAVAMTTVACLFLPVAQQSDRWGALAGMPQLIVLALSVWEVGGLIVLFLAPLIAGTEGPDPNLAALATLRTAVLSAASVTLALSSRYRRWPEARWLVYPVLIVVAIKLFAEDFPNGQPASLFVALSFVGGALLLVARLLTNRDDIDQGEKLA